MNDYAVIYNDRIFLRFKAANDVDAFAEGCRQLLGQENCYDTVQQIFDQKYDVRIVRIDALYDLDPRDAKIDEVRQQVLAEQEAEYARREAAHRAQRDAEDLEVYKRVKARLIAEGRPE